MNGADLVLATLARHGVRHLFGNPGSTELPLIDALTRQGDVEYVLGLHEAAVMGMADGYAQATGGLAVVNVHVQPGIANALSGVLNAARARVPLLVTVGQQVTGLLQHAPFLGGDVLTPVRGLAVWAGEPRHPDELPGMLAEAMAAALRPPCGPAVLSLPMDVLVAPATGAPPEVVTPEPPAITTDVVDSATSVLGAARAPVILAGDGVAHEGAGEALGRLADLLGAPVWGEPMAGRVSLPWGHPRWAGQLPPFAAQIAPILERHDAVLAVGMPVFRLFGHSPGAAMPGGMPLVHVDADPQEIGRSHAPAVGAAGSVRGFLEDLGHRLAGRAAAPPPTAPVVAPQAAAPGDTITPAVFSAAVAAAVGPDDLLVDESLTSGRGLRAHLRDRRDGTWLAHRGSALGWGLPAAVGAKLANPDRRVMVAHGDGSLLFGVHALWTAAHMGLGVAVVVADNGGYEILRAGMEGLTGRPEGGWPGLAMRAPRLDVGEICRGFGASVDRCAGTGGLEAALGDLWLRARHGPAVLVVGVEGRTPPVGYPVPPAT
ncbi:MAG: thiamine pyrophosphate-binding protein [Thermoleophilia bacterium]